MGDEKYKNCSTCAYKAKHGSENHDHEEALAYVKGEMPSDETLCDLADLFKVVGDTTRVKILSSLFESELCVYEIARLLGMEQSAISHQLQILRREKLVGTRREGKTVFYFLADDHVATIINNGLEHILEDKDDGTEA